MSADIEVSVSEFVALLNQTLDFAYPSVVIIGELANFKVWRDRLVFFDLKDDEATVNCFAFITQLPGPLEDGMLLKVRGQPRYHETRGFSFNVQRLQPAGEGSIRRAADLLQAKLAAEGLFDESRKRGLPYPPRTIGLVTSAQSAAYADFVKILAARWGGLDIQLLDVQVQGDAAPGQIVQAIEYFNAAAQPPDVLVVIRGGGSPEDLAAFSTEQVTRAVAASRVPTLVAIGHEIDLSLAELAADQRASTPSNAAELLVPDRAQVGAALRRMAEQLDRAGQQVIDVAQTSLHDQRTMLHQAIDELLVARTDQLARRGQLLQALSPTAILQRGYAIVTQSGKAVRSVKQVLPNAIVNIQLADGSFAARTED